MDEGVNIAEFLFKCPQCGQTVECDDELRGMVAECPHCGKGIVVPRGEQTPSTTEQHSSNMLGSQMNKRFNGLRSASRTRGEQVPLPSRFVDPPNTDSPDTPSKRHGTLRKTAIILCSVAGAVIIAGVASYGGYLYFGDAPRLERGIEYYKDKRYDKAFSLIKPIADKGNAEAQLYIGNCYANGNGTALDSEEAARWFRKAADQGLAEAQYRMFICCRDGIGMEPNVMNAAKWCRKAAEAEFEEAMFHMGMLYVKGTGVEKNAKSAFKWFRKGAERGNPSALYNFGLCYKQGYGVEKDQDEASKWQNKAVDTWRSMANAGDLDAMLMLAQLYKSGDVVELDKEEAVKWYRKAADLGNAQAQFLLATCYQQGDGIETDNEEAAKWMLKSAEQGTDKTSQWMMGRFYQDGVGVEKDPARRLSGLNALLRKDCQQQSIRLQCAINEVRASKGMRRKRKNC